MQIQFKIEKRTKIQADIGKTIFNVNNPFKKAINSKYLFVKSNQSSPRTYWIGTKKNKKKRNEQKNFNRKNQGAM